jgi:hypothetical protein
VQSGSTITGTALNAAGQVNGTISGVLRSQFEQIPISFTVTPTGPGAAILFEGSCDRENADLLRGTLSSVNGFTQLTRQ